MYSAFSYRRDSKHLNHKGRIIRTKSDYQRPSSTVINQKVLDDYINIIKKFGRWPSTPGPTPDYYQSDENQSLLVWNHSQFNNTLTNGNDILNEMGSKVNASSYRYIYYKIEAHIGSSEIQPNQLVFPLNGSGSSYDSAFVMNDLQAGTGDSEYVNIFIVYDKVDDIIYAVIDETFPKVETQTAVPIPIYLHGYQYAIYSGAQGTILTLTAFRLITSQTPSADFDFISNFKYLYANKLAAPSTFVN